VPNFCLKNFTQSSCSFATLVVYPNHQKTAQDSLGSFAPSHSLFQITFNLANCLPPQHPQTPTNKHCQFHIDGAKFNQDLCGG